MKLIDILKFIPLRNKVSICEVVKWSPEMTKSNLFHIDGDIYGILEEVKPYYNYKVKNVESFIDINGNSRILITIKENKK